MTSPNNESGRKRKMPETSVSSYNTLDGGCSEGERQDMSERTKVQRLGLKSRSSRSPKSRSTKDASKRSKSSNSSFSSDEEIEKCPICLRKLESQTLSVTDTCNHHIFCLDCLQEWSKTRKTCPVDRIEYKAILVLDSRGKVKEKLPIKPLASSESSNFLTIFCEVCGLFHSQHAMVICDGCNLGFHLFCLIPPMDSRPSGVWLCDDCWDYYNY
ncbi:PHD and RING finger domain-containing protein 1-like [Euwallacea similis]|uniref:PHD and RING finger domain-containing protein 1-like n=1 Tax=Euwallacea similis TaxID=1736056 RepID=UPI00344B597F